MMCVQLNKVLIVMNTEASSSFFYLLFILLQQSEPNLCLEIILFDVV